MGVPKKRKSKMKTALRRSHHALEGVNLVACSNCKTPILPHRMCPGCGFYGGKQAQAAEA
ncbi:50S ribosomal protein L32 [bacterium]|nr:50S ribosomal protein L32 [bacterium]